MQRSDSWRTNVLGVLDTVLLDVGDSESVDHVSGY